MIATSKCILLLLLLAMVGPSAQENRSTPSGAGPQYAADGRLKLPEHYREWVWLTADFHTASHPANMQAAPRSIFNNIFVDPGAYKAFLETGAWPDKTILVVEQRGVEDMGSRNPNQNGSAQGSVSGIAVHIKDEARFPGKWAFFGFQGSSTTASMIPATARCYSCHAADGATDTTFIQFYPTLLPVARSKQTLSPAYLREHQSGPAGTK